MNKELYDALLAWVKSNNITFLENVIKLTKATCGANDSLDQVEVFKKVDNLVVNDELTLTLKLELVGCKVYLSIVELNDKELTYFDNKPVEIVMANYDSIVSGYVQRLVWDLKDPYHEVMCKQIKLRGNK